MKRKIYTKDHDINLLQEIDNNGDQFTADEHAYIIEKEFSNTLFKSKKNLLQGELPTALHKLGVLGFLVDRIIANRYNNILSLGAGSCVLEYILKLALPDEYSVVASDFNNYFIGKAKIFFPEITPVTFDFFKDDIVSLQEQLHIRFDIAVFMGSAYVMDDPQFIKLFGELKKSGVKEIIDFHAGYMDWKDVIRHLIRPVTWNPAVRRILGKPPIDGYIGKFHGYSRSRSELKRLYLEAGLEICKEISVPGYKYVAILK